MKRNARASWAPLVALLTFFGLTLVVRASAAAPVTYAPSQVGDDAAAIAGLLALGYDDVRLVDGTYHFQTALWWPVERPGRLVGRPGTKIVCTGSDGCFNFDGYDSSGAVGTLAADAPLGATSITVSSTAGLSVGSPIILQATAPDTRKVQTAYVLSLSGGGVVGLGTYEGVPLQLVYTFAAGDQVLLSAGFPRGVRIEGHGMTVVSAGSRWVAEALCGWNLVWEDMTWLVGTAGDFQWGGFLDIGSRGCIARGLKIQYTSGAPITGLGLAYCTDCDVERCSVTGAFSTGLSVGGSRRWKVSDALVEGAGIGLVIDGEAGAPGANDDQASRWGVVSNVTTLNSSAAGFLLQDGGSALTFRDCVALKTPVGFAVQTAYTSTFADNVYWSGGKIQASSNAIQLLGGSDLVFRDVNLSGSNNGVTINGPTSRVLLDHVTADDCTGNAFTVQSAAATGVELRAVTGRRAGNGGLVIASPDITVHRGDFTDAAMTVPGGAQINSFGRPSKVVLEDVTLGFSGDAPANVYAIAESAGGTWSLSRVSFSFPSSPAHYLVAMSTTSATYTMRDTSIVSSGVAGAGGASLIGILAKGGTFYDLGGMTFALASDNAYSLAPGTKTNWFNFTANGASDVVVSNLASPGPQAVISCIMATLGGTPAPVFQSSALAGGSVSMRSSDGNTGTYACRLQLLAPVPLLLRRLRRRRPAARTRPRDGSPGR